MRHVLSLIVVFALSACAADDDYPKLSPTEQLLAEPELSPVAGDATDVMRADAAYIEAERTAAQAREAALHDRADTLRAPVIETDILARMKRAQE